MLLPGDVVPQSMDDKGVVQALSEYTPIFADVVIDPAELKVVLTETAPYVVKVSTNPVMIKAIVVAIDSFRFAICPHCLMCCFLSLNKYYCLSAQQKYRTTQRHSAPKKPKKP
jgi:hypothetical protein